jgi:hypothetical protein
MASKNTPLPIAGSRISIVFSENSDGKNIINRLIISFTSNIGVKNCPFAFFSFMTGGTVIFYHSYQNFSRILTSSIFF